MPDRFLPFGFPDDEFLRWLGQWAPPVAPAVMPPGLLSTSGEIQPMPVTETGQLRDARRGSKKKATGKDLLLAVRG